MQYKFKDMLDDSLYETAQIVFVLGPHTIFNNIVCDRLKSTCISDEVLTNDSELIASDFGIETVSNNEEDTNINSVDFNTFMDVKGIASILGKWYCNVPYGSLNTKQRETLSKYIKTPSNNGLLVITSSEFKEYINILKMKMLKYSKTAHIVELSFPNRNVLKQIVSDKFSEYGISITDTAVDMFISKMSAAYDEYDEVINKICEEHTDTTLNISSLKEYMKGIEHFVIEDFVKALMEPIPNSKTNNKKILRIMVYLEDEYGAENLIYKVLKIVNESIQFRILINKGIIPIGINYFFKDVINNLGGEQGPYGKMNEWVFRKKALLASSTSLKDWHYMKLILEQPLLDVRTITEEKCRKALYELCMRTVLTSSRLDNCIGIDNVLNLTMSKLNRIKYDENALKTITDIESKLD